MHKIFVNFTGPSRIAKILCLRKIYIRQIFLATSVSIFIYRYSFQRYLSQCFLRISILIDGWRYSFTPKKLLQKVSQRFPTIKYLNNNILKVYQNRTTGNVYFSKWRPRWPPNQLNASNFLDIDTGKVILVPNPIFWGLGIQLGHLNYNEVIKKL